MVKIRQQHPIEQDDSFDVEQWLHGLQNRVKLTNIDIIRQVCHLGQQVDKEATSSDHAWSESNSGFHTGLEMADILADLHLDQPSIIAAIIYRAVREQKIPLSEIENKFGKEVAKLIDGTLRMASITTLHQPAKKVLFGQIEDQADSIRKMLIAIIDDVRVALIKLAERTCAIRAVKNSSEEKKKRVAREVFDIYAPLAHRLGIGHIKWELEDLSFRYLQPEPYKKIATLLDERRMDRDQYIKKLIETLQVSLIEAGIAEALITGRAKHIYSIWRKMQRKDIDFSEVYDIRAVRVLVPEIKDCYAALGVAHALWRHIPKEFDDYIATPKENGYRSLHTAVIGPEGKILEVQIRTKEMHEEAELGVCSHWRYKGNDKEGKKTEHYEAKISWLRQVLEWHEEIGDISELIDQLRSDGSKARIYVFTPEGHVVDLPQGATPVDFAYRIHTEVGHRCRGAKINGKIVPLNQPLKIGEQVEILTGKQASPSRDWLNHTLRYIATSRARAKVQHWFKQQSREQNIIDGRALISQEFQRLAINTIDLNALANKVNYKTTDDMYAAVGAGDLRLAQVLGAAHRTLEPDQENQLDLAFTPTADKTIKETKPGDIRIQGVGNLLTHLASCCKPVPGDTIIGYITLGKGVSVHRQDCSNASHLETVEPDRMIEVNWGTQQEITYPVDIVIKAYDRSGLLRDITSVLADEGVNLIAANTRSNAHDNTASMLLTLQVSDLETLGRTLAKIDQLPNVVNAKRFRQNS